MEIKVLGSGCANCERLVKHVTEAAEELGIFDLVIKVTDPKEIMAYGVMSTPALVVNGKVLFAGRVPGKNEVKKYLQTGKANGDGGCGCNGCC